MNCYRPVKQDMRSAGPSTVYSQLWHISKIHGTDQPDLREELFTDLTARIKEIDNGLNAIFIAIDANKSIDSMGSLTRWCKTNNMTDIHALKHGHNTPSTYIRGNKRIDYIFTNRLGVDHVNRAGITAFHEFHQSDHWAVFIVLNTSIITDHFHDQKRIDQNRGITSQNPKSVTKYCSLVEDYLNNNTLEEDIEQLKHNIEANGTINTSKLEELDCCLTEKLLKIEKQIGRMKQTPWSPILMKAKKRVRYWKLWL